MHKYVIVFWAFKTELKVVIVKSLAQSAVEWLMSHSWAILVVVTVGATFMYLGVFETSPRPRFEGLGASGLQPTPDHVMMYYDGIMVLTVMNTRPYRYRLEWVEVAPIVDKEDTIWTIINDTLSQGSVGVYGVNATNLLPYVMEAGISRIPEASGRQNFVEFILCMNMTFFAGGTERNQVECGDGHGIQYIPDPHPNNGGGGCRRAECPCITDDDCWLDCEVCIFDSRGDYCSGIWCETNYGPGGYCAITETHPRGECLLT